jgi:glutaredoxin
LSGIYSKLEIKFFPERIKSPVEWIILISDLKKEKMMITLFTTADCAECAEIEEMLDELRLAHQIVLREPANASSGKPSAADSVPLLVDGKKMIPGSVVIREYLRDLAGFKAQWDKYQSDACYCDEEEIII